MTNGTLRQFYREINRHYFDNKLPNRNISIRFGNDKEMNGDLAWVKFGVIHFRKKGKTYRKQTYANICISHRLKFSSRLCVRELIHEMVHVKHVGSHKHGRVYRKSLAKHIRRAIHWY